MEFLELVLVVQELVLELLELVPEVLLGTLAFILASYSSLAVTLIALMRCPRN